MSEPAGTYDAGIGRIFSNYGNQNKFFFDADHGASGIADSEMPSQVLFLASELLISRQETLTPDELKHWLDKNGIKCVRDDLHGTSYIFTIGNYEFCTHENSEAVDDAIARFSVRCKREAQ